MPTLSKESENVDFPMPKVTIDRFVLERIRRYVGQCNTEISGFGFATQKDDHFHIMDARVCKQDAVSGAHTDINKDALNQLMFEWKDRDGVLVWWHSHVNMDTFWSSQDRATIMDLGKNGMCLAVVFNKKHEQRCAMSFKVNLPFRSEPSVIMLDELSMSAVLETNVDVVAAWDKELADALPTPVAACTTMGKWGAQGWGDDDGWGYHGSLIPPESWDMSEFWESSQEGAAKDCDWRHGSMWVDGVGADKLGRWRKSWQQRMKEKAEKTAGTALVTATNEPSFIEARRKVALDDDEIIVYHPLTDEYELANGIMVDAEWYLRTCAIENHGLSEADLEDLYDQVEREKAYARN